MLLSRLVSDLTVFLSLLSGGRYFRVAKPFTMWADPTQNKKKRFYNLCGRNQVLIYTLHYLYIEKKNLHVDAEKSNILRVE